MNGYRKALAALVACAATHKETLTVNGYRKALAALVACAAMIDQATPITLEGSSDRRADTCRHFHRLDFAVPRAAWRHGARRRTDAALWTSFPLPPVIKLGSPS